MDDTIRIIFEGRESDIQTEVIYLIANNTKCRIFTEDGQDYVTAHIRDMLLTLMDNGEQKDEKGARVTVEGQEDLLFDLAVRHLAINRFKCMTGDGDDLVKAEPEALVRAFIRLYQSPDWCG